MSISHIKEEKDNETSRFNLNSLELSFNKAKDPGDNLAQFFNDNTDNMFEFNNQDFGDMP